MVFYTVIIELVDGKFDYDVPDIELITNVKYHWFPENLNYEGLPQGIASFEYPDDIGDNIPRREEINTTIYNAFATVGLTADKLIINNDGVDGAEITAQFDTAGGDATFNVLFPDTTKTSTTLPIDGTGKAVLAPSATATTQTGTITVSIKSDSWHDVNGLGDIEIESV